MEKETISSSKPHAEMMENTNTVSTEQEGIFAKDYKPSNVRTVRGKERVNRITDKAPLLIPASHNSLHSACIGNAPNHVIRSGPTNQGAFF